MDLPPSYDNVQSQPSENQSFNHPQMLQPATAPHTQFTPANNVSNVAQPQQLQKAVENASTNSQPFCQQPQPAPSIIYADARNQQPYVIHQQVVESYTGHAAFACFVFWCCNWLFGFIAWILAQSAEDTKHNNRNEARRLGNASVGLSIFGFIVTIGIIVVLFEQWIQ